MTLATHPSNAATAAICSELVEYRNPAGLRISAYFDHDPGRPFTGTYAVMAPPYTRNVNGSLRSPAG